MKTIFLLLASAACTILHAQNPDWTWAKNAGGNSVDVGNGIATDATGNVYVVGNYTSVSIAFGNSTLVNAGTSTPDIFLAKYSPDGAVIWAKSFGGTGIENGFAVAVDADNNVCISGNFTSPSVSFGSFMLTTAAIRAVCLVKLDTDGNVLWAKAAAVNSILGSTLKTDLNGSVYVGGSFGEATASFDAITLINTTALGSNLFLAKYDAEGNVLWAKNAGGTAANNTAQCSDIETDNNNNVYMTGYFLAADIKFGAITLTNHSPDKADIYVTKYDAAGNEVWALNAGGTMNDIARGMTLDKNGNVWITGWFEDIAAFGNIDITSAGSYESYLAKYSPDGNALWAGRFGGTLNDYGTGLCTAANGNIILAGSFRSPSIDFDASTFINKTSGKLDMYLANFDTNGKLLWVKGNGGFNDDGFYSVVSDASDHLYSTGFFNSDTLVMDSDTLFNKSTGAFNDVFIARITDPGIIVPLTFTSMAAQRKQNGILVEWRVVNELNIGKYTVQKSTDGVSFADMQIQAATENRSAAKAYQWLDLHATAATVFYRIKSDDRDHVSKYSGIVSVAAITSTPAIAIYPNPVKNKTVMLQMRNVKEAVYTIRVINRAGQIIAIKKAAFNTGNSTLAIPLAGLIPGDLYMLEVSAKGQPFKSLPFILE